MNEILKLINIRKWFPVEKSFLERLLTRRRLFVRAVDEVSLNVRRGETLALVGESGCGKTTLGKLMIRLIDPTSGRIIFDGQDITDLKGEALRRLRRRMQIIYQDPYASLNPRMPIGEQVAHPLRIHGLAEPGEVKSLALRTLEQVGLTPPEKFYDLYPRALSGGQRQRVAIARAIIMKPEFIVADEPVSMIDVSLRASILDLMIKFKKDLNLTYVFITHDLAVAKYIADAVAVMYLGKIVEYAPVEKIYQNPLHPYTKSLMASIPIPRPMKARKMIELKGEVPNPINPPSGCRFWPRCPIAHDLCSREEPELREIEKDHFAACFYAG